MRQKLSRVSLFWGSLKVGGVESVMITLAEEFLERGIDTDIVLMRREGNLEDCLPSQASVFDLGAQNIILGPPTLAQYLRRRQPSVVLSAGYTNRIALLARELTRESTSVVTSEHRVISDSESNSRLPDWLLQQLSKWTYPLAERMIAVSKGVADDISQVLGFEREELKVIHNPVIGPETFEDAKQNVEHPWFSDRGAPVIIGVGRLVEEKDFSTLMRAFAKVRENRRARLVILGEGEKRSVLEHQAEQLDLKHDLWMPGFVSNPLKYMANASVFVLSSRWEGLPTVLIEAMASGTPVVSSDCPSGPAEILEGGRHGALVPVGDPDALAAAIKKALDGLVAPAPRSALDRFRRDRVADQYLDILTSLA